MDILYFCVLDEYEELTGTASQEKMTTGDTEHEQAASYNSGEAVNHDARI